MREMPQQQVQTKKQELQNQFQAWRSLKMSTTMTDLRKAQLQVEFEVEFGKQRIVYAQDVKNVLKDFRSSQYCWHMLTAYIRNNRQQIKKISQRRIFIFIEAGIVYQRLIDFFSLSEQNTIIDKYSKRKFVNQKKLEKCFEKCLNALLEKFINQNNLNQEKKIQIINQLAQSLITQKCETQKIIIRDQIPEEKVNSIIYSVACLIGRTISCTVIVLGLLGSILFVKPFQWCYQIILKILTVRYFKQIFKKYFQLKQRK